MKRTVCLLIISLSIAVTYAQDPNVVPDSRPGFIISGNIGGDASIISLGFEKLFFLKSNVVLAGKVGFGYNSESWIFSSEEPGNLFTLPHSFTVNLGNGKRSYGELGIGGSWITNNSEHYYFIYPMAGYRYHPFKNPGFSFKIWVFYPFGQTSKVEETEVLISPLGVSFGIAF